MKKLTLSEIHNLALNCGTPEEISSFKGLKDTIKTKPACYPLTVLSIYYFEPSQNDPKNSLKRTLTRTYIDKYAYYNPLLTEREQR